LISIIATRLQPHSVPTQAHTKFQWNRAVCGRVMAF